MKLVVLMAVEEYADKLKKILIDNKVPAFSESEMLGFKLREDAGNTGWFANKHIGIDSHIIFTFVKEELAGKILEDTKKFTSDCDGGCPLRAFQLDVEKFV